MIHRFTLLSVAVLLFLSVPAIALEILEVDGGSITASRSSFFADVAITGPRLGISTLLQLALGPGMGFQACAGPFSGCLPGTVLPIGGFAAGSDFFGGTAILDGVPHLLSGMSVPQFDTLALITTGSLLIPQFGNIESVVLATPFGLTGQLFRSDVECSFSPPACSGDPFSTPGTAYSLHGQGVLHLSLHRHTIGSGEFWEWDTAQFDFQPIPEPVTLLLWGTGAAGLGLARWYRRRTREREHAA
jgi:hypothetical protein